MNKTLVLLTSRISNIAIIGLWLWADARLTGRAVSANFPQQYQVSLAVSLEKIQQPHYDF
jgi:hypothetical protein